MDAGVLNVGKPLQLLQIPPRTPSTVYEDRCEFNCGTNMKLFYFGFHSKIHKFNLLSGKN